MQICLTSPLMHHQRKARAHLRGLRVGGLFMEMGTGKTITAFALMAERRDKIDRVVWFCPVSLLNNFRMELHKHCDAADLYLFDQHTTQETLCTTHAWYGIGIESIGASDRIFLAAVDLMGPRTAVIIDESTYIKSHCAKRTRRILEITQECRYRFILTGTPLSQGIVDLYAQLRFLSHKILGFRSFWGFARHHLEYSDKYPGLIVSSKHTDEIARKAAPFVYQVTKRECLDLPAKQRLHYTCQLTAEQEDAYSMAKAEILDQLLEVKPELVMYVLFQLFGTLQQIANGFWRHPRLGLQEYPHHRTDLLETLLREIPAHEPVIIWTKYLYGLHEIARTLQDAYPDDPVSLYHGGIPAKQRGEVLDVWQESGRFLVATPGVGGHGLTLTKARYAIFYNSQFKYAEHVQAEDRIHRIGQTRSVTYLSLWSNCGIEDRIHAALHAKRDTAQAFRREVAASLVDGTIRQLVEAL